MSSRKRTPSQAAARDHGSYRCRRATNRDVSTNACIRQMGGGHCRKPLLELSRIHARLCHGQRPLVVARPGVSTQSDRMRTYAAPSLLVIDELGFSKSRSGSGMRAPS